MKRNILSLQIVLVLILVGCGEEIENRNANLNGATPTPIPTSTPTPNPEEKCPAEGIDPKIVNKVNQILVDELGIDENEIKPTARLWDELGGDELDVVEVIIHVEKEFGIEFPEEREVRDIRVCDVYNYVKRASKN